MIFDPAIIRRLSSAVEQTGGYLMKNKALEADSRMISKLFFRLLPAQILLVAVGSINSLIDGAIAARFIGPLAMAIIGLYAPAIKIIETVNGVLLGGSQILCGQFLGKNQIDRTRSVFSLDMLIVTAMAGFMTLISLVVPEAIAAALGANQETLSGLRDYIFGMGFGILPQFMTAQLTSFLQIEQQQKRTYIGIGLMAVLNVALDWVFIAVLKMDMLGLGLATSISCWVLFLVQFSFYVFSKPTITFRLKGIQWGDIAPIIKIGLPGAIAVFCLAVRGIVLNNMLLHYSGNDGVSALSAMSTCCGGFLYAITAGLGSATRLLGSIYIGEEDRTSLILVMRTALFKGVGMVCVLAILVSVCSAPISSIFFTPGTNVFNLTRQLFLIYPLGMPLIAITVVMSNYFQSANRMKIVHLLSVMDGLLGTVLSSLILAPLFGAIGVWVAHVLNSVYTVLVIFLYARWYNKRTPRYVDDLLAFPAAFGIPEDQRLDLTIHNAAEVTETSGAILEFCQQSGIDSRKGYYAALCMEEMASNIVKHGFSGRKDHTVDVRVVNKPEGLRLRIKDDCKAFNPREKLELIDPSDVTHNIGLRMVQHLSREMSYQNVFGLNVLTIDL